MNHSVRLRCLFVLITIAVGETASVCRSPYLDLCGYNADEYNSTEIQGSNDDNICNCLQVAFCSLIELSEECKSATVLLSIDGNITASTQLHCDVSALDSQTNTTVYEVSTKTENEFTVKVFTEFDFGRFKIVCDAFEIPDEFCPSNESQWNVVSVTPSEVVVDSQIQLQLTIAGELERNLTQTWCFVKTPDDNIEILSTSWASSSQIDCIGFSPATPGVFMISLSSFTSLNVFDTSISVKVTSKHPVAQVAEYSYDFERIFIYFNENIELQSTCASVFPNVCLEYFGVGFKCSTRGNVLVVKMGRQFKITSDIAITADNRICQAGAPSAEFCLSAQPVSLAVSKPKRSDPNLSVYLDVTCGGSSTEKHMSVRVTPSRRFTPENQIVPPKNSGKEQRKNLMMWRMMRRFQGKLSSRRVVMEFNSADILPVFEGLTALDNALDAEDDLGSAVRASVVLQSSPGTSSVLTEANVRFCEDSIKLIRYKWVVNGRDVSEDGKLLILRDLAPGKYIIKCVVVGYNSSEVLGQGWTTTEIIPAEEKLLIIPAEIIVGQTDDVSLRAETWHGSSVSWTCRTNSGELCRTSDKKLVSDLVNLNSRNISIPAGTLPVGIYVWTAETSRGSNNAKVFIKDGNVAAVGVEIPSVFVKPSEKVVLQGTVGRLQSECRVWWSSVRQKEFNYLDLKMVAVTTEALIREGFLARVPLVISSDSESWKNVEPDAQYLFQLQVFCPHGLSNQGGSFDYLKVPLVVSDPPRVSPLTIEPLTGEAMVTKFSISGAEADASVDDHPLVYEWSYVGSCNLEVPIGRGAFPRNFTTYLPPGDIKLIVRVCNVKKICVTTSSPTIDVIQGSDFPADNFHKARHQIRHLMTSGDILEAFGLAITTFKSLAFLAEPEIREEVFLTVEEAIKERTNHLAERARSDPKTVKSCLDFFERAVTVAKYFRKGSDILSRLTEFRDGVLMNITYGEKLRRKIE